MAFNPNDLTTNPVSRIRLEVGDTSAYPIFPDTVYTYYYQKNLEDELSAAIEVLEAIIQTVIISPDDVSVGDIQSADALVAFFNERLLQLRQKKFAKKGGDLVSPPLAIRSDRKNWDDLNNLFKGSGEH